MINKVIPVILAGGIGVRLWPISKETYPKQFHSLIGKYSFFQQTVLRSVEAPLIVCNKDHQNIVLAQLNEIKREARAIIVENELKNTAPAAIFAALYMQKTEGDSCTMMIVPSDHLIQLDNSYYQDIEVAKSLAKKEEVVIFGVKPTEPNVGYGYIHTSDSFQYDENGGKYYNVRCFKEKPDFLSAKKYIACGEYYWNSGIVVCTPNVLLNKMYQHAEDLYKYSKLSYEKSKIKGNCIWVDKKISSKIPSESIDYALLEKLLKIKMVALSVPWYDIGSWSALWRLYDKDDQNNSKQGNVVAHNSNNNLILNKDDDLVVVSGVDDVVVVKTDDTVLVLKNEESYDVKQVYEYTKKHYPVEVFSHRQVYRPWGSYKCIDEGDSFKVKRIIVGIKQKISLQSHKYRSEHWVVVSGIATVYKDSELFELYENESTYIPAGSIHRLENNGSIDLEIVEVQSGSYLGEDDIFRLEDEYGREVNRK